MAFLFLFWANFAVADPFKAALESMCAEAQAQVHYVDPNLMDLRSLTPGLPDAIQSYHFWVTVHQALQKLHTAYAQFPALLPEMTPYYHLPSIQASLRYLLIQFNQAARAAYNDLPSLGAHFEVGMPRESIEELSQFLLDIKHRTEIDRVSHPSHPHVLLNVTELERLWRGAYHSSAGYEFLMDHFMDFKGLYDFFNFTLRFYIPGAAALPVTLPDLDDSTWVGRIHRKVVSDLPKVGSGEAPMQILLIEMMDLQTTMDPLLGAVAKERDAVAAARKANAKKNAKKKQRKKIPRGHHDGGRYGCDAACAGSAGRYWP